MKVFTVSIVFVVLALMTPAAFADKPSKPPGQDDKSEPATCIMEEALPLPEGHGYVSSAGQTVDVDRAVQNYGPVDQMLFIHKNLLPPDDAEVPVGAEIGLAMVKSIPVEGTDLYGPYYGQVRVLDSRVDYSFDIEVSGCVQDNTAQNLCPFHLVVVDGNPVYIGRGKTKTESIAFRAGRSLLYYRPCNPAEPPPPEYPYGCFFQLYGCYDERDCPGVPYPDGEGFVFATFDVKFQ